DRVGRRYWCVLRVHSSDREGNACAACRIDDARAHDRFEHERHRYDLEIQRCGGTLVHDDAWPREWLEAEATRVDRVRSGCHAVDRVVAFGVGYGPQASTSHRHLDSGNGMISQRVSDDARDA